MFGFGGLSEVFFILLLALLIFGPEKLPEIGRMLAKGMAEVRKASNELKRTLNAELAASEQEQAARRNLQAVPAPAAADSFQESPFQASEPAPTMPPRWPVASTIPAIEPFPAATPAAPAAHPSHPMSASETAAAGADGPAVPEAEGGAAPDPGETAAAAPSPLLAPYGEGGDPEPGDGGAGRAAVARAAAAAQASETAHGAGVAGAVDAADVADAAGAAAAAHATDAAPAVVTPEPR